MISIVDYGVGNIYAFLNLFQQLGISAQRSVTPESLNTATHLILPGVGHFDRAMNLFNKSGLRPKLEDLVLGKAIPIIGVCVGMQMLAEGSDEGILPGLNWIPGRVRAFTSNPDSSHLPNPHMGWNNIQPKVGAKLFANGFADVPEFYFLHSYYFDAEEKSDIVGTSQYGINFAAVVSRGSIHGIQGHPEKSHRWGKQLLKNFSET